MVLRIKHLSREGNFLRGKHWLVLLSWKNTATESWLRSTFSNRNEKGAHRTLLEVCAATIGASLKQISRTRNAGLSEETG
jgi:hypothetical protein